MSKYPMVKLGDVCIVERGGSPRPIDKYMTKNPHGINWIKIGDAPIDSMYITKAAEKIIPEGVSKSRKVKKGDFILSNSMSFGRPYILDIDGCIHDGWLLIRDANGVFEKQFLYYYLSSETVHAKLKQMAVGGVVNNLNSNKVRSLMIPVLRKEEQVKICEKLNKITTIIQYRKQQLIKLDELAKSRFIEMFGDVILNDKNWETKKIKDIAPSKNYDGAFDENVWLLNLDMVESHTGEIINYTYVQKSSIGSSICSFNEEYILYSKLRPYLNKVVIPDKKGFATSELVPLKPIKSLNRVFLAYLLRSDSFVKFISTKVAGAKMPRVSMNDFRNFECLLPPIELQIQFSNIVEQLDKSKFRIKKSLKKLELTYKALLQEYFG